MGRSGCRISYQNYALSDVFNDIDFLDCALHVLHVIVTCITMPTRKGPGNRHRHFTSLTGKNLTAGYAAWEAFGR